MSCNDPIGLFDSGVGGLSVLTECVKLMPHEKFIYLADRANMPYGRLKTDGIKLAALGCAATLAAMNCKAIAVACNTATETAISEIRRLYPTLIVVGLEPAVKPCREELCGGYAVALVTDATARSAKFMRLLDGFGDRITVAAQPELATLIEQNMSEPRKLSDYVYRMLQPYKDAESIILGCSHYAFVKDIIADFYGGNIKIYDGAKGEAARLRHLLSENDMLCGADTFGSVEFYTT